MNFTDFDFSRPIGASCKPESKNPSFHLHFMLYPSRYNCVLSEDFSILPCVGTNTTDECLLWERHGHNSKRDRNCESTTHGN